MQEYDDLITAFESVARQFSSSPADALRPWIDIDDMSAHYALILMIGLIDRSQWQDDPLIIRDRPAHKAVLELARQAPWNQVLRSADNPLRLEVVDPSAPIIHKLCSIMARYHKAIE